MNRFKAGLVLGAALATTVAAGRSSAMAQTFQTYRCADNTQFIIGFFERDSRAHMHIGGRDVALARRLTFSGARYSGGGITLKIAKIAASLKYGRRPLTTCERS